MTPFQLHIYICEVELQCELSLAAAESVNKYFKGQRDRVKAGADAERAQVQLFGSLHSFLTHAALVSRLLWPSIPRRGREKERGTHERRYTQAANRGKQVRRALGIQNKEPSGQRTLRDHLEHFDERLDGWVLTSNRRTFIDLGVGTPNRVFGPPLDTMRWFDQTDWTFHFRGERFDLSALVAWIKTIHGLAAHVRRHDATIPPAA